MSTSGLSDDSTSSSGAKVWRVGSWQLRRGASGQVLSLVGFAGVGLADWLQWSIDQVNSFLRETRKAIEIPTQHIYYEM